ncbi:MAG: division/cell wall cluster transcriptional repressor MraZ [Alphaproteobacteria bacterium]
MGMGIFLSTFVNRLDKKGRVSVPSSFRASLAHQNFQGIILFRSYTLQAIEGFGIDRMEKLSLQLDTLDLFSDDQNDLAASIFADAHQLPFDGEGRVMLPELLCDHAGLSEQVAFVGRGATFQLWDPDRFKQHQQAARERLKEKKSTLRGALLPSSSSGEAS